VNPVEFGKTIVNYKYHVQGAWNVDVLERITGLRGLVFTFLVVAPIQASEPTSKWRCKVLELNEASVEKGQELYRRGLEIFNRCITSKNWSEDQETIEQVSIAGWGFNE
jgi:hypothetical protein